MRRLRSVVPAAGITCAQSTASAGSFDSIESPNRLAHALMDLDSLKEEYRYAKRIRMSRMHDICLRDAVLGFRNNILTTKRTEAQSRVTFDIGNAIHDFMQNHPDYFGDRRIAWWKCVCCGVRTFGKYPKTSCAKCGALPAALRHDEHHMKLSEPYLVSGHTDMFLEMGPGDFRVVDFKTINGDEFASLDAPKGDHVIQLSGYMHFLQYDKTLPISVNPSRGVLFYVSKKHEAKAFPLKAFHVDKNQSVVKYLVEAAESFTRGIRDDSYTPEPLQKCVSTEFTCSTAKWCVSKSRCQELHNGR